MATNIKENETHYTFHSNAGSIGDSFYYFTYWYNKNFVLVTRVQGKTPSENAEWISYLDKSGIQYELIGTACLVPAESVERLFLDERTFTGGGEIYVLHKRPAPEVIPEHSYPAEEINFNDTVPDGFLADIKALDALVYISDGKGANIAHKLKEEIIYYVREIGF